MTDLMDILYQYAEEKLVRGFLDQEGEYANVRHCADQQERMLRELVSEENKGRLEDLLEERKLMAFFEGRALFRAGFRMAMELAR